MAMSGRPLLRLRDRRGAAGDGGRELARRRVGSERRHVRRPRRRRWPSSSRSRSAGCSTCSRLPPGTGGGVRDRRHDGEPHERSPPRGARCCRAPAGTSRSDGLFGAPRMRVVVGAEAHPTVRKALGLLGLGRARAVRRAGATRRAACAPTRCPSFDGPRPSSCLQAGNVNTGAFDPLAETVARAHGRGRVGARGRGVRPVGAASPARCAPRRRASRAPTRGRPTRTSGSTCRTTAAWCSSATPAALRGAMSVAAAYLPAGARASPRDYTPELVAARPRRRGVGGAALAGPRRRARPDRALAAGTRARFAEGLRAAGIEVLNDVVLNQVLVSFGDDARNRAGDRRDRGRRHVLVRRHGVAGPHRDAHQRVVVGDHRERRRAQPRRDGAGRTAGRRGFVNYSGPRPSLGRRPARTSHECRPLGAA